MAEMFGFKIIRQYEQGVVFRFGQALPGVRMPGLTWINPFTSRLTKVNMQIAVASVPAQETITRDNVTLKVDAVVYYRVIDPLKAIINVQNYHFAVSQVAQTSLRSVTGRSNMDQLLSEREQVNAELKDVIDAPTEGPWGVRVERVEVKDILPESRRAGVAAGQPSASVARGSSPPTGARPRRSWPRPPRSSWRETRRLASCGCCRPGRGSKMRRMHPRHAVPVELLRFDRAYSPSPAAADTRMPGSAGPGRAARPVRHPALPACRPSAVRTVERFPKAG
jgi:hypothetical protein